MTRIRQWSLGTAGIFILILLLSWFLLISPKKSEAADIQSQAQTALSQNDQLRLKLQTLQQQSAKLADQEARLAAIRQHLPPNLALASFIRTTSAAASGSNVSLDAVAPSEPAVFVAAAAGAAGTSSVEGAALMAVKVEIKASGSYYNIERFLDKLEGQKRSLLVTAFAVTPGGSGKTSSGQQVSIDVQARIYYLPLSAVVPTTTRASSAPTPATN